MKGNPLVLAYLRQNAPLKLKKHISAIANPTIAAASVQTAESANIDTPSSPPPTATTRLPDDALIRALQPNSGEEQHNVDEPGALADVISGVRPDDSQKQDGPSQSFGTHVDVSDNAPDSLGDTQAAQNIVHSDDPHSSSPTPASRAQQKRSNKSRNSDGPDTSQKNANSLAATRGRRKRPHQEIEEDDIYEVEAIVGFAYGDDVSAITC